MTQSKSLQMDLSLRLWVALPSGKKYDGDNFELTFGWF